MEAKIRPNQTTNKDKFLGAWIIGHLVKLVLDPSSVNTLKSRLFESYFVLQTDTPVCLQFYDTKYYKSAYNNGFYNLCIYFHSQESKKLTASMKQTCIYINSKCWQSMEVVHRWSKSKIKTAVQVFLMQSKIQTSVEIF